MCVLIHQIFGAFCSESWQVSDKYYGTGNSFLYMVHTMLPPPSPPPFGDTYALHVLTRNRVVGRGLAQLYPKKAFYLWTGANNFVQLSGEDFLSVGGYPALASVVVGCG